LRTAARTRCLALAALAVLTPAFAQAAPNPDLDRDGKLSASEYRSAYTAALFGWLDKNKDGKITRAEFATLEGLAKRFGGDRGARRVAAMWQADADTDGAFSRREMDAQADKQFKAADTNQDGLLDKAEQKAAQKAS
jgi:hypothetical protein